MAAVRKLPIPTDLASLWSALGLLSYYRKFLKGFSAIASPLHQLLQKGAPWIWDTPQQEAYGKLKDRLCTAEVLQRPDSAFPYTLTTDWSQKGMGAILSETDSERQEHPISYASRFCNPADILS